jgi:hypothetical protein
MIPCVDIQEVIKGFQSEKGLAPLVLKPEAPWIKKCAKTGSIKFTDEIYITDDSNGGRETPESESE